MNTKSIDTVINSYLILSLITIWTICNLFVFNNLIDAYHWIRSGNYLIVLNTLLFGAVLSTMYCIYYSNNKWTKILTICGYLLLIHIGIISTFSLFKPLAIHMNFIIQFYIGLCIVQFVLYVCNYFIVKNKYRNSIVDYVIKSILAVVIFILFKQFNPVEYTNTMYAVVITIVIMMVIIVSFIDISNLMNSLFTSTDYDKIFMETISVSISTLIHTLVVMLLLFDSEYTILKL